MQLPRIPFRWSTAPLLGALVAVVAWGVFVAGSTHSARVQAQPKKPSAKAATADLSLIHI